ncbi:predicted protein [Chaetoceros tenuissimus]|uniref:Uncharacterized protein n=1 Tax=Chaetoceros tenuissimus TaxID=426638 RepID=A0AAD3CYR1_9STRA|nr:predicted protein [Chaetoceros tenuissimus]
MAADNCALKNKYELCWKRSCHIRQVIFETSGLRMEQLIVMACVLSWKPGDRIGQPIYFLYSKIIIAQTMHPEYIDTYPHDAIPPSHKIEDCYNEELLKPHRAQAQEKCKEVARKIRDAAESTLTLVDTNKKAWSIDTETNEDVDPAGRHLNFYLSLGFRVVYEDEDAILLYTPKSKSFVYFVGPLCRLLGHHSFKTKENRASSTRRACSAEVFRQLSNMAKKRKDGGRDDCFENIILADHMAKTLDHQYHADKRFSVAIGKDILTKRHIMSQDRKYSDLPLRTRNTLSLRTVDKTQGREGASSGDYEPSNLDPKAIYKRLEQFGKKKFILCPKLRNSWINFCRQKASNRGNRDTRGWKAEELAYGNACVESLNAEAHELFQENPRGELKVWVKTTKDEKDAALEQNTDQNQPDWKFEEHLQMPFKGEGLRNRYKRGENAKLETFTLTFEKVERGLRNKDKPLVTRNNSEYKLFRVFFEPK